MLSATSRTIVGALLILTSLCANAAPPAGSWTFKYWDFNTKQLFNQGIPVCFRTDGTVTDQSSGDFKGTWTISGDTVLFDLVDNMVFDGGTSNYLRSIVYFGNLISGSVMTGYRMSIAVPHTSNPNDRTTYARWQGTRTSPYPC